MNQTILDMMYSGNIQPVRSNEAINDNRIDIEISPLSDDTYLMRYYLNNIDIHSSYNYE